MKKLLSTASAIALAAISTSAFAQPSNTVLETFDGISGAFDGSTTPAGFAGGGTIATPFTGLIGGDFGNGGAGGLSIVADDSTDFPNAADTQYLTWDGNDDQFALWTATPAIPGTDGTIYAAFAFQVVNVDSTLGSNTIEIFRLGQDASFSNQISISIIEGDLELNDVINDGTNTGTFAGSNLTLESGTAAAPGGWRVLAVEANLDASAPNSDITVTEITSAGAVNQLGQATGFQADFDTGVTDYGIGAFITVPAGTNDLVINLDEVRIYDNTEVLTTADFIEAVGSDYWGLVGANVNSWELYQ